MTIGAILWDMVSIQKPFQQPKRDDFIVVQNISICVLYIAAFNSYTAVLLR